MRDAFSFYYASKPSFILLRRIPPNCSYAWYLRANPGLALTLTPTIRKREGLDSLRTFKERLIISYYTSREHLLAINQYQS